MCEHHSPAARGGAGMRQGAAPPVRACPPTGVLLIGAGRPGCLWWQPGPEDLWGRFTCGLKALSWLRV